ncbi:hypothetical protein CB1_000936003 [Camelus ferus]|nr:hypothetical protein CB1_000936003 [Camelus ferus]
MCDRSSAGSCRQLTDLSAVVPTGLTILGRLYPRRGGVGGCTAAWQGFVLPKLEQGNQTQTFEGSSSVPGSRASVDEVIAVSEKVIVKLEDLVKWVHSDFSKWRCGLKAGSVKTESLGRNGQKEALLKYRQSTLNSGLNFKDVLKEKADLGNYHLYF